jgi:hypothetical protein
MLKAQLLLRFRDALRARVTSRRAPARLAFFLFRLSGLPCLLL